MWFLIVTPTQFCCLNLLAFQTVCHRLAVHLGSLRLLNTVPSRDPACGRSPVGVRALGTHKQVGRLLSRQRKGLSS